MTVRPYILFPLIALAHVVNVSKPGEEPPVDLAAEDLRLWDPALTDRSGGPMGADARRRHFMADRNRRGRTFTTDHVWTFHIWQQVRAYGGGEGGRGPVACASVCLCVLACALCVCCVLGGSPAPGARRSQP